MRNQLLFATAATFVLIGATTASANDLSAQDFVTKVSISDKFEIESSKLAISKSKNDATKDFADQMVQDHTKTTKQLKEALAKSDSKAKPASKLDEEHQAKLDKLKKLSGKEFDEEYADIQEDAHEKAVSLFSDYSEHGDDAALKQFASTTLPALKQHLKHAESLED